LKMEHNSTYKKDPDFPAESYQSSDTARQPTSHHCIELGNTSVSKQPTNEPHDVGTCRAPSDVLRQVSGTRLERSTSDRADYGTSVPRWDGISVWVPNTAAASSTPRRRDERRPVQRCQTMPCETPSQPIPPTPPPPTTTTTPANTHQSRGTKLFVAAGNTLARARNFRPSKFIRKFSTYRNTTGRD